MCSRRALIFVLAEIGMGVPLALCQTLPSAFFDAVSIKPWNMESVKLGFQVSGARLDAGAVSLRDLIAEAYQVNAQGIAGTSSWMETETYNIHATAGRLATPAEFRTMLQNMLADRFHLMIHRTPKLTKVYALVVDKGGPKLTPRNEAFNPAPPPGMSFFVFGSTIRDLLRMLNTGAGAQMIGRLVVDRTDLTGEYYIALAAESHPLTDRPGVKIDLDYFTALKRDLGLRLDPIEESVDQIVVVSATRPTAN